MKSLIILIFLCLIVNLMAIDIEPDKAVHFTAIASLYIGTSIVCEYTELSQWIPFTLCIGIGFIKEWTDPYFNWKDIYWDNMGLGFGFIIRWTDLKQRR